MPNPDNPDWLVHFTGRPESFPRWFPPTPEGAAQRRRHYEDLAALPEARMHGVFQAGGLVGQATHGTTGRVLCFSELTLAAIATQISTGFVPGRRPPYAPWALVLNKAQLAAKGVRPVLYISADEMAHVAQAPAIFRDRCVRSTPGSRNDDWTHEREWRLCAGDISLASDFVWGVPITAGLILAVIVGRSGWQPQALHPSITRDVLAGIKRWLFRDGQLYEDGTLVPDPRG